MLGDDAHAAELRDIEWEAIGGTGHAESVTEKQWGRRRAECYKIQKKKWGRGMCVRVHEHEILGDLLQLLHRVYVVGAEVAFDQQQVGFELGKALD